MPSAYWTLLKMKMSQTLQYRGDMLIYTIEGTISAIVALSVWLSISTGGSNLPLNRNEIITYFLLIMFVGTWTNTWSSAFIPNDIRQGRLSRYLVKPISYSADYVGNNIAEKIQKTVLLVPLFIVLLLLFNGTFVLHPSPWTVLVFVCSLLVASVLYFIIDFCIGLLAFWTDEISAIYSCYAFGFSVFSGELIPLQFLPSWAHALAHWLPFRYTLSLPVEIIQGRIMVSELITSLALQLMWLGFGLLLYRFLWSRGIRRYSSSGS